jgi:MFS family permease
MSNLFSTLMYLLLSSVNTVAARWGLSFFSIGLINFVGALSYITTSFILGRLGDKYGHKKVISYAFLFFAFFNILGFFWSNVVELTIFVIGVNVFFGTFFPQLEGLLSKREKLLGIDAASTVSRFNLSWSTGNIVGILLGPFLILRFPSLVFIYAIFLNFLAYLIVKRDLLKNDEQLSFTPSKKIKIPSHEVDFPKIKIYRRNYRLTLVLSGLVYSGFLSLFPKIAIFSNIALSISGFLAAAANIGVLMTFVILEKVRIWVGKPSKAFLLMIGFPITVFLLFVPPSVPQFLLLAFFAGITYAVPYTYAIFYALNSPDEDHSKQGGFHEATIGMLSGLGPLLGGMAIQISNGLLGLAVMALTLLMIVIILQLRFVKNVAN